jgi:hypothetical protein
MDFISIGPKSGDEGWPVYATRDSSLRTEFQEVSKPDTTDLGIVANYEQLDNLVKRYGFRVSHVLDIDLMEKELGQAPE